MVFYAKEKPVNPKLKEWFSWRATAVTDHQIRDLTNKLADEIVMRGRFLTCLHLDKQPVRVENGQAQLEPGTKISAYTLKSDNGEHFLPLFTDAEEFAKWQTAKDPEATDVVIGFDDTVRLLHTFKLFGFVVNPFSDNYAQTTRTADAWEEAKVTALKMAQKKLNEMKKEEQNK